MIHVASDDKPDIATYCSRNEVLELAAGIDTDDDDLVFSSFGAEAVRNRFIDRQLPMGFKDVNMWARRDFAHHASKTVTLDGMNTDVMILSEWGFYPLLDVASLTIDDSLIDEDDYKTYYGEESRVEYAETSVFVPPLPKRKMDTALFTGGVQNVSIVMTWGYVRCPDEIRDAQCYAVIARCLRHLGSVTDPKSPGIPAGTEQVTEGPFRFAVTKGGRYSAQADAMVKMAKELCFDMQRVKVLTAEVPDLR